MEVTLASDPRKVLKVDRLRQLIVPDDENCLFVKCGDHVGRLHLSLFFCPGIHENCIQLPDGQIITPKQFVIVAGRDKHKDWKGAITVHRKTLRTLMDFGIVQFYSHEERCSKRCAPAGRPTSNEKLWEMKLASQPMYPAALSTAYTDVATDLADPSHVLASTDGKKAPFVIVSTKPVNADQLPQARLDAKPFSTFGQNFEPPQSQATAAQPPLRDDERADVIWDHMKKSSRQVQMTLVRRQLEGLTRGGDDGDDDELIELLSDHLAKVRSLVEKKRKTAAETQQTASKKPCLAVDTIFAGL